MRSFEKPRRLRRTTVIAIALIVLFALHLFDDYTNITPLYWQTAQLKGARLWDTEPIEPYWEWNVTTDAHNLLLTHRHCEQAFHGLFKSVDQSVRRHRAPYNKIKVSDLDKVSGAKGVVRAMIYNQQLYVISTGGSISSRSFMVLAQIHRALITSPEQITDIEFTFTTDARPAHHSRSGPSMKLWAFARPPSDYKTWLMPEFGFHSWPGTGDLESFHDVRRKAEDVDHALDWEQKKSRLLWRGGMNDVSQHGGFLDATSGASWADVQAISHHHSEDRDQLDMSEHCKSKYLVHTETTSYDGQLKYLQLCKSVILVPSPARWTTYHSHLMQKDGPEQNYLAVKNDWSDLEDKVRHLQSWDTLGERIAKNSVATFRDRSLTPAAEVCSWRRLFKGWAEVLAFEPELYEVDEDDGTKRERGVLFERYLMQRIAE